MTMNATRLASALRAGLLASNCGAVDGDALTNFCTTFAEVIVDEITDYAEAVISTSTAGLQTSTAAGSPTAAPSPNEKTLPIR